LGKVVGACYAPACFAGTLHGWEKKTHERANDCDNHEQFNKRKSSLWHLITHSLFLSYRIIA